MGQGEGKRLAHRRGRNTRGRRRSVELDIEELGFLGDGKAMLDGVDVLIPGTLPGERWNVEIEEGRGKRLLAKPVAAVRLGERAEPICRHFGTCGGCSLQHLPQATYDDLKRRRIADALRHQAVETGQILQTARSPLESRRRMRLAFDGFGRLGLRSRQSNRIVDLEDCPIAAPEIVGAFRHLRDMTRRFRKPGEAAVTLADNGLAILLVMESLPPLEALSLAGVPNLIEVAWTERPGGFCQILQQQAAPVLELGGQPMPLPPGAFLQATREGESALQHFAMTQLETHDRIADLFCGLGTFGLPLAAAGKSVSGFDADAASIKALRSRRIYREASIADLMDKPISARQLSRFDAVILDPPRAGAQAQSLEIANSRIDRLIYASCNPASFARDCRRLREHGFSIDVILPVDQFIFSAEVELIASLSRR
jgi:23S rRNA (uracil1939-C5)-methyltransferase